MRRLTSRRFPEALWPGIPKIHIPLDVHSDLKLGFSSPGGAERLQGCDEMHQAGVLQSGSGEPCESVVQSHHTINTDTIPKFRSGLVHAC
uniref:Uncharacterized protein n=1 Tax=Ornithorhynchus anatinus TaxID=9258 RepID=A0A6I8MXG0_ORNAN